MKWHSRQFDTLFNCYCWIERHILFSLMFSCAWIFLSTPFHGWHGFLVGPMKMVPTYESERCSHTYKAHVYVYVYNDEDDNDDMMRTAHTFRCYLVAGPTYMNDNHGGGEMEISH